LYINEIYELALISYQLIASPNLDVVYDECKAILKEKNIGHQIVGGVSTAFHLLGCIDPSYRFGKPLKFHTKTKDRMILAMIDRETCSNMCFDRYPVSAKSIPMSSFQPKVEEFEFLPLEVMQREDRHYTCRLFIEFNYVDSYGPLQNYLSLLAPNSNQIVEHFEQNQENFPPCDAEQQLIEMNNNNSTFNFDSFFKTLPKPL
jgi:hypothetical protein